MRIDYLTPVSLALLMTVVFSAACQKPPQGAIRTVPSLLVDTMYDDNHLPPGTRIWAIRLMAQIGNPDQFPNATEMAGSNDTYIYGRALNTHITSLLQVLRVTGNRRLLDEIDRLSQLMRACLEDRSILEYQGTAYSPDGFLNWQYFYDAGYHGSDIHEMDEMFDNSLVAALAYAFHVNRRIDPRYAERADFWTDYLRNHFEAKWRARKAKPEGFPFLTTRLSHVLTQWIRYHYYMNKLTGDPGYLDEARRMAAIMERHFQEVPSPRGAALRWTHGIPEMGEGVIEVQTMNYARYTVQAAADLALEGFDFFARNGFMTRMSRTLSAFLMDDGAPDSFARYIDGHGEARERLSRYLYSPFCQLAYWDDSGRIVEISALAYMKFETDPEKPRCIHIPAGMVFSLMKRNGTPWYPKL